jgi:hypothetical protein
MLAGADWADWAWPYTPKLHSKVLVDSRWVFGVGRSDPVMSDGLTGWHMLVRPAHPRTTKQVLVDPHWVGGVGVSDLSVHLMAGWLAHAGCCSLQSRCWLSRIGSGRLVSITLL